MPVLVTVPVMAVFAVMGARWCLLHGFFGDGFFGGGFFGHLGFSSVSVVENGPSFDVWRSLVAV